MDTSSATRPSREGLKSGWASLLIHPAALLLVVLGRLILGNLAALPLRDALNKVFEGLFMAEALVGVVGLVLGVLALRQYREAVGEAREWQAPPPAKAGLTLGILGIGLNALIVLFLSLPILLLFVIGGSRIS